MSGGSYDYAYSRVASFADDLRAATPLRRAFRDHLRAVAAAMRAIEWVDSGDLGVGDEDASIRACLDSGAELAQLLAEAKEALAALSAEIAKVDAP